MTDSGTMITGEENTRMASVLALRHALILQIKGFGNHGRSPRTIAQELLKLPGRPTSRTVYAKLNSYIVEQLGPEFDRPWNT